MIKRRKISALIKEKLDNSSPIRQVVLKDRQVRDVRQVSHVRQVRHIRHVRQVRTFKISKIFKISVHNLT
jgi:hypothetical protein